VQAGHARNDDFNGPEQDGMGMYQVTQRNGMRASAAVAYLHPVMERENLTVMPYMFVERVLFEGTRAVGVQARQLGELKELRAAREVILAAGAYNSPQLLMLSGVGPAEHLALREVELVLDQPNVGENLSDHVATQLVWTTPEPESLLVALEPWALEQFEASQTGPYTTNMAESGGFARADPGAPAPDVQFHLAPVQIVDEGMTDPTAHGLWASVCLLTPEARGSVRLAHNDPTAKPIVRNNFYSRAEDLRRMITGLRMTLDICAQPAMAPYAAEPFTIPDGDSDEAITAHAVRNTFSIYHPVGTCRMGTDGEAVVDDELRVNGLEGLRVVDASVMPVVPRGNTNAPVIAVAERAADLILHGRALAEPIAASAASAVG
jgi:choline dehydrogenase